MERSSAARALIVLDRTELTPRLLDVVRWRARRRSCSFALLVPMLVSEELFGDQEAQRTLGLAMPALEEAARGAVTPMTGPPAALLAIERALVSEHLVTASPAAQYVKKTERADGAGGPDRLTNSWPLRRLRVRCTTPPPAQDWASSRSSATTNRRCATARSRVDMRGTTGRPSSGLHGYRGLGGV